MKMLALTLKFLLLSVAGTLVIMSLGIAIVIADVSHSDPLGLMSTPWHMVLMAIPIAAICYAWNSHAARPMQKAGHACLDAWYERHMGYPPPHDSRFR